MIKQFAIVLYFVGTSSFSFSQVWSENFNDDAIPPGWVIRNDMNNYEDGYLPGLSDNGWVLAPRYDSSDPDDKQMVTTSMFSPAGTADRWLISPSFAVTDSAMVLLWEDLAFTTSARLDKTQVWVSPSAGTGTTSFTDMIFENPGGDSTGNYTWQGASLSDYYGQTIRIAFRDNTYDGGYIYVDNVATEIWNYRDAGIVSVNFPTIAGAGTPISITINNNAASNIESVKIKYSVDYIDPVEETVTGLNISPSDTFSVTLSTTTAEISGTHTIFVEILEVNGSPDEFSDNNLKSKAFTAASISVARAGLVEDFGGSFCTPCAYFNSVFDPLALENNANDGLSDFNVIKYQMDWPETDLSYNDEADARRDYYGIDGIPQHFNNGVWQVHGIPTQQEIDVTKATPAYVTLSGYYSMEGDSLIADITVLPHFSLTGNFSLHMAATQAHYTNLDNSTGQNEYYDVMRDMLPDGNGSSITELNDGVPLHFRYKKQFEVGVVTYGSHTFWSSPAAGSLVVFLQNDDNFEVLQSKAFRMGADGLDVLNNITALDIYPNPAQSEAYLSFIAQKSTDAEIAVYDLSGKKIAIIESGILKQGKQSIKFSTLQFNSGLYFVIINTPEGRSVKRLNIIK